VPFLYVTLFYMATAYMFIFKMQANLIVSSIFVSTCLTLAILTFITLFYKISIHSAGMMGVTGYLIALSFAYPDSMVFYSMIGILICSGLVMSARLELSAHQPKEVLLGAVVGFTLSFTSLILIV